MTFKRENIQTQRILRDLEYVFSNVTSEQRVFNAATVESSVSNMCSDEQGGPFTHDISRESRAVQTVPHNAKIPAQR